MKLQLKGTRLLSAFGLVLGAMFVPYFFWIAVAALPGVGFVPTVILVGVLWFLATIGLGVRFGDWRALFLAVVPGPASLLWTNFLFLSASPVELIGNRIWLLTVAIITLIWLVGLAVGVLMRKLVFWRSQSIP